jgi:hypothetical protein
VAANRKARRKAGPKGKKTAARKSRSDQIPLQVLEKRLARLGKLVNERRGRTQLRMWD